MRMKKITTTLLAWMSFGGLGIMGQLVEAFRKSKVGSSPLPYRLLHPEEFGSRIRSLAETYPDFIRVRTAKDVSGGVPTANMKDCPYDFTGEGCETFILTIQDFIAHPVTSKTSKNLPELFLTAAIHGDDSLGPTSLIETVQVLVDAASCEARPSFFALDRRQEIFEANLCRDRLREKGIDDKHRRWLARMVSTRRIVVLPVANSQGFFKNRVLEDDIDPYKDFPFLWKDHKMCMQSMTARLLNDLFREHMFQIVLSFQRGAGGQPRIEYSWASPAGHTWRSPDHKVQHQISNACRNALDDNSTFIGPLTTDKEERGVFEDWSYAGSWYLTPDDTCTPEVNNGYPVSKTKYSNSTNRALSMRITSGRSGPYQLSELGTTAELFSSTRQQPSLVAGNVRIVLAAMDLIEPYVTITRVDDVVLSDDVIPQISKRTVNCLEQKAVAIPAKHQKHLVVKWSVGGSISIARTELFYKKWSENDTEAEFDCIDTKSSVPEGMKKAQGIGASEGKGRFSTNGAYPSLEGGELNPTFEAKLDASHLVPGDKLLVIAMTTVDQDWSRNGDGSSYDPDVEPQSHMANVRTSTEWSHENNGRQITGHVEWYSTPIILVVSDDPMLREPVALFDRFAGSLDPYYDQGILKNQKTETTNTTWRIIASFVAVFFALLVLAVFVKKRKYRLRCQQLLEAEMEDIRKELEYRSNKSYTSSEASSDEDFDYTTNERNVEVVDWELPDCTFE